MLAVGYLNTAWNVVDFSAVDCTLNIVVDAIFSLYLNICRLRKGSGKFFIGVLESPRKVLDFLSVKEWEPCFPWILWFRENSFL